MHSYHVARYSVLFTAFTFIPYAFSDDVEHIAVIGTSHFLFDDAPSSVIQVDTDWIDAHTTSTLQQLGERLPELTLSANAGASKVYFRGVGSQGNAGLAQTVAVILDNSYQTRSRSIHSALIDVEDIAIFQGAQLGLQGVNSTAGVISVSTHSAELGKTYGYTQIQTGDFGRLGATAVWNQAFGNDVSTRGVVHKSEFNGYWRLLDADGQVQANSTQSQTLYRLANRWQITDALRADLKLSYQSTARENPFAWQPTGCNNLYALGLQTTADLQAFWSNTGSQMANPLKVPSTCKPEFVDNQLDTNSPSAPHNRTTYDAQQAVLTLTWQHDNTRIDSISSAYDNHFLMAGNDLTHGAFIHQPQSPTPSRTLWQQDDIRFISQAFRIQQAIADDLSIDSGIYCHQAHLDYLNHDVDARNTRKYQTTRINAQQTTHQLNAYLGLAYQLHPQWTLSSKVQYVNTRKRFSGQSTQINKQSVGQHFAAFSQLITQDISGDPSQYAAFASKTKLNVDNQAYRFDDWLPEIALQFAASNQQQWYLRWTQGAKTGGFNTKLNNLSLDDIGYTHESVNQFTLGTNMTASEATQWQLEWFVADYRDLQQNSHREQDGDIGAGVIRNASRARVQGMMMSFEHHFTDAWSISSRSTWLDSRYRDYQFADCTRLQAVVARTDVADQFGAQFDQGVCYQDLSGKRMPHAPVLSVLTSIHYQRPLFIFDQSLAFDAQIDWQYSAEFFTSPHADALRQQPSFHKLNAWLSLTSPSSWSLTFSVQNLNNAMTAQQFGQDANAAVSALLDPPRRMSLQAKLFF